MAGSVEELPGSTPVSLHGVLLVEVSGNRGIDDGSSAGIDGASGTVQSQRIGAGIGV